MGVDRQEIFEKIESYGTSGIKRKDLREEFGKDVGGVIDEMSNEGDIVVDKKGAAYHVWSKSNYLDFISKKHPKILEVLQANKEQIADVRESTFPVTKDIEHSNNSQVSQQSSVLEIENDSLVDYEEFEHDFKRNISKWANSLGWAPLSKVRESISETKKIDTSIFYEIVGEIIQHNSDRYELSTGGSEGIQRRGMNHGFVRCV